MHKIRAAVVMLRMDMQATRIVKASMVS